MTRQGYECYKLYLALQRHFSTSYDFHKYNGKVNASVEAYDKRNDIFSFEKLSKLIPVEDRVDFFVAHFVENPKMWIRNMSKQKYEAYKAKIKNFPTTFKEDLELISQYDPSELMKTGSDIPLIHKLVIDKKVNVETIIVMDKHFPFIDKHSDEVKVPFVFPDHITMLKKYRPFLKIKENEIYKDIMVNVLLS